MLLVLGLFSLKRKIPNCCERCVLPWNGVKLVRSHPGLKSEGSDLNPCPK